jgi:hypothetical protein
MRILMQTTEGTLTSGSVSFSFTISDYDSIEFSRSGDPLEVILLHIIQQCLCEGDTCKLALDSNFVNARFRAHQIYYLHIFGLNRLYRRLAVKAVARAFDVQPKAVRHALEKGETIPKGRAEHPALEVDTEQHLTDWITKNVQNHMPFIEQSYFIIAAKLLEQRLHRGESILFHSEINSSYRRR